MLTVPRSHELVNPDPDPDSDSGLEAKPAYYGILPAPVRYCKALSASAKLLFCEITALCSVKGFCWASNAHFMALYEVDRSTIQRWLSSLSRAGFVRIELAPETGQRRIYDLTSTPPQKSGPPAAGMRPPRRENAAHSIKLSIKENNKKELLTRGSQKFVGPAPISAKELKEKWAASPAIQSPDGQVAALETMPPNIKQKEDARTVSDVPSPVTLRKVERAIVLTKHEASRSLFNGLWEEVRDAGHPEVWQMAVEALKPLSERPNNTPAVFSLLFADTVRKNLQNCLDDDI